MGEIVMPRLSDTMEEGTILRWLKDDGEHVTRGSELVEIETDKAAMTYESDQEGILEIVAPEGATLAVGELIARVGPGTPATAEASANGQRMAENLAAALAQSVVVVSGLARGVDADTIIHHQRTAQDVAKPRVDRREIKRMGIGIGNHS